VRLGNGAKPLVRLFSSVAGCSAPAPPRNRRGRAWRMSSSAVLERRPRLGPWPTSCAALCAV
jgi:hypothetical protein